MKNGLHLMKMKIINKNVTLKELTSQKLIGKFLFI
jgi:hypothetical protein